MGQAAAGTLPGYESNSDTMVWNNANTDYSDTTNSDNFDYDGGGGDDFGGYDS